LAEKTGQTTGQSVKEVSEPKKKAPGSKKPTATKKSSGALTRFFFWLLIGTFVVAICVAGGLFWQQQNNHNHNTNSVLGFLDRSVTELKQQSDSLIDVQSQQQQLIQKLHGELNNLLPQVIAQSRQLTELSATSRSDWRLAEALYLARLASQRLHTERRVENPLALLEQVDLILQQLADPQLLPVRAAIAEDITALRLANSVDRQGIYLELQALAKHIQALPVIDLAPQNISPNPHNIEDAPDSAGESFWQQFSSMIRIHRQSTPIEPLLQPTEAAILRRNLQMMLEQAQVALLREEQIIYRQSLFKVRDYLDRFFQYNSSVEAVEKRIAALTELEIEQQLPAIYRSVEVLETLLIARQQRLTETDKPARELDKDSQTARDGDLDMEPVE